METKSSRKSVVNAILNVLQAPFLSSDPKGDDHLVTLISVAKENPLIRNQLLSILRQPAFQRQSMINTWLEDLALAGAPPELRNALSGLLDEYVADRALDLLTQP